MSQTEHRAQKELDKAQERYNRWGGETEKEKLKEAQQKMEVAKKEANDPRNNGWA